MISQNVQREISDKILILLAYELFEDPVEQSFINKSLLLSNLMDYFSISILSADLVERGLLLENGKKRNLSIRGIEYLDSLKSRIPENHKEKLALQIKAIKQNLPTEGITSNVIPLGDGSFVTKLQIKSDEVTLFSIEIKSYTEKTAEGFTKKWKNEALSIYKNLVDRLTL